MSLERIRQLNSGAKQSNTPQHRAYQHSCLMLTGHWCAWWPDQLVVVVTTELTKSSGKAQQRSPLKLNAAEINQNNHEMTRLKAELDTCKQQLALKERAALDRAASPAGDSCGHLHSLHLACCPLPISTLHIVHCLELLHLHQSLVPVLYCLLSYATIFFSGGRGAANAVGEVESRQSPLKQGIRNLKELKEVQQVHARVVSQLTESRAAKQSELDAAMSQIAQLEVALSNSLTSTLSPAHDTSASATATLGVLMQLDSSAVEMRNHMAALGEQYNSLRIHAATMQEEYADKFKRFEEELCKTAAERHTLQHEVRRSH